MVLIENFSQMSFVQSYTTAMWKAKIRIRGDVMENVYKLEYDHDWGSRGERMFSIWYIKAKTKAIAREKAMKILNQSLGDELNEDAYEFTKIFFTEPNEE
jgi:hypothetical protein